MDLLGSQAVDIETWRQKVGIGFGDDVNGDDQCSVEAYGKRGDVVICLETSDRAEAQVPRDPDLGSQNHDQ